MERSFAAEVKQLALGEGQTLRGEGILAITKALLQSAVSYVGGYPGAPVSHLLDVLADANEPLLKPMGGRVAENAREPRAGDHLHDQRPRGGQRLGADARLRFPLRRRRFPALDSRGRSRRAA